MKKKGSIIKVFVYVAFIGLLAIGAVVSLFMYNKLTKIKIVDNKIQETGMKAVENTFREAEILNENSYLGEMAFLQVGELTEEELEYDNFEFPPRIVSADGFMEGLFFRYPDEDTEYKLLTEIYITGGEYSVFGIKVGDDYSGAEKVLEKWGYKKLMLEGYSEGCMSYEKRDVVILLATEGDFSNIVEIDILTNYGYDARPADVEE